MTNEPNSLDRSGQLAAQLLDGKLSPDGVAQLNSLFDVDAGAMERDVDHVLLDSLLRAEVGAEPLTALVDLIDAADVHSPVPDDHLPAADNHSRTAAGNEAKRWGGFALLTGWASTAIVAVSVVVLLVMRHDSTASAEDLLRAALLVHGHCRILTN